LVYEHIASGEVWLIEDPGLKLGELQAVQEEVAHLLSGDSETAPAVESAPATEATPENPTEPPPAS